jgi:hypothetical protein
MIITNKYAQVVILACMFLLGFLMMKRVTDLNREGAPTVARLRQISDAAVQALGVTQTSDVNVVNKITFLLVERDLTYPLLTDAMVQKAVAKMHQDGWVNGKAGNDNETALCKHQIIVDIYTPSRRTHETSGYLGVNWGDAVVRCPSSR